MRLTPSLAALAAQVVVVRPGAPNAALTGAWSTVVREPLAGEECTIPVPLDARMPVASYQVESTCACMHAPSKEESCTCSVRWPATCPLSYACMHACTPQVVCSGVEHLLNHVSADALGADRSLMLPSLTATPGEMLDAARRLAGEAHTHTLHPPRRAPSLGALPTLCTVCVAHRRALSRLR